MTEATELCLGKAQAEKRRDWFDEDCKIALIRRNKAKIEKDKNNTQDTTEKYKMARREVKQICRKKKREHLDKQLKTIEESYVNKEIRNFYQEVKKSRGTAKSKTSYCRGKDGVLLGETTEKLNRWAEYFEELLNENKQAEPQEIKQHLQDNTEQKREEEPTYKK
uniref:Uncharacterized protein LOC114330248 n=1 Tax=Diabrotica virgifera virgifera TaxID=50390 RepID=A0A6P7FK22_DIAVI